MTRREQYLERRRRYTHRRELMYQRGHNFIYVPPSPGHPNGQWLRNGRETPIWSGPNLQGSDRVKRGPKPDNPNFGVIEGLHFEVTDPARGVPPIARWIGATAAGFAAALPSKQRLPGIRYHNRRVHYVGRKPDRMNGFQRRCWGAAVFAKLNEYFPDWDPLHGRPNYADFLGGWVFTGPFRPTPGP